jgi:hypothetical protein
MMSEMVQTVLESYMGGGRERESGENGEKTLLLVRRAVSKRLPLRVSLNHC